MEMNLRLEWYNHYKMQELLESDDKTLLHQRETKIVPCRWGEVEGTFKKFQDSTWGTFRGTNGTDITVHETEVELIDIQPTGEKQDD